MVAQEMQARRRQCRTRAAACAADLPDGQIEARRMALLPRLFTRRARCYTPLRPRAVRASAPGFLSDAAKRMKRPLPGAPSPDDAAHACPPCLYVDDVPPPT